MAKSAIQISLNPGGKDEFQEKLLGRSAELADEGDKVLSVRSDLVRLLLQPGEDRGPLDACLRERVHAQHQLDVRPRLSIASSHQGFN